MDTAGAPLVGTGEAYRRRAIAVPISGSTPRSGGFSTLSARNFLGDIPSLRAYFGIVRGLRRLVGHSDRVIVMGDAFALLMARVAIGPAALFVSLPKSEWHLPHTAIERQLMRACATRVLTRDAVTADALRRSGLPAHYLGNPLVDDLTPTRPLPAGEPLIALLPGSRDEATGNLGLLLDIVQRLPESLRFAVAAPDWLDQTAVARVAHTRAANGWVAAGSALVCATHRVEVYRHRFPDVIHASTLALGMAGTANEQAAGLGRVVVTCCGTGPQSTRLRLRQQEQLLGGAAVFVDGPADAVANRVRTLLHDPEDRASRGACGRARMGAPGASARIADVLIEQLQG